MFQDTYYSRGLNKIGCNYLYKLFFLETEDKHGQDMRLKYPHGEVPLSKFFSQMKTLFNCLETQDKLLILQLKNRKYCQKFAGGTALAIPKVENFSMPRKIVTLAFRAQ